MTDYPTNSAEHSLLKNLVVAKAVKKSPSLVELECYLPCPQENDS
jgi:hypothetical protein